MAATNAPKPPDQRRRRNAPERGEWQATKGVGWQHGEPPAPPPGLLKRSKEAWSAWMRAWFAAHWSPDDLPGLRVVIRLYDQVERGEFQRASELRLWQDTYGITLKGQQDRRWVAPAAPAPDQDGKVTSPASPYGHLRVLGS